FKFVTPRFMCGTALKTGSAVLPTIMAALFSIMMPAPRTEMVLSQILRPARRILTPRVSGVVVMLIRLTLIHVRITSIGGRCT
ncbi:xanthine permease XanP, partial [Klebsiella pneumoniae]